MAYALKLVGLLYTVPCGLLTNSSKSDYICSLPCLDSINSMSSSHHVVEIIPFCTMKWAIRYLFGPEGTTLKGFGSIRSSLECTNLTRGFKFKLSRIDVG